METSLPTRDMRPGINFPINGVSAFLQSDSHLKIKIIRIFVSTWRHLGENGGAVKIGSLKPVIVPDIKVQVAADGPLET